MSTVFDTDNQQKGNQTEDAPPAGFSGARPRDQQTQVSQLKNDANLRDFVDGLGTFLFTLCIIVGPLILHILSEIYFILDSCIICLLLVLVRAPVKIPSHNEFHMFFADSQ